jgi:hypothetical protein
MGRRPTIGGCLWSTDPTLAQVRAPRDPRLKDGWRAAAAAYRKAIGVPGMHHSKMMDAAEWALKEVVPDLSDRLMLEAVAAVHYAGVRHSDGLYALHQPMPKKG